MYSGAHDGPAWGERPQREAWLERKGPDGMREYMVEKNGVSIDGLPAFADAE